VIKNRVFALVFRLVSAVIIIAGLIETFRPVGFSPSALMYYTVQSNLLALIMFVMLIIKTAKDLKNNGKKGNSNYFQRFEMVCCINLLLTLVVFWILLAPTMFSMGSGDNYLSSFHNLSVHLFAPLLCVIDYILFSKPKCLKYRDVFYVLIFPMAYLAFASIAGLAGYTYTYKADSGAADDGMPHRFPYFCMDFDRIGAFSLVYIGILVVFFLILSHGLYFLNQKPPKPKSTGPAE
jgi:hypothetical protein